MSKQLKSLYVTAILLLALELMMVLSALPFLPDSIPAHYNAAGEVNRWGSKYETIIFPAMLLPYGAVWLGISRLTRGFSSEKMVERLLIIGGIIQFAVFDLIILYFLYADFRQVENLSVLMPDLNKILCAAAGLGFIALGNYLPKLKKPGPTGLRTPWSVKNDVIWRKCQRFGGWAMAAAGVLSIAAALLVDGAWCWLWLTLFVIAATAAGAVYSYLLAKADPD